jgi:hypothetical protein
MFESNIFIKTVGYIGRGFSVSSYYKVSRDSRRMRMQEVKISVAGSRMFESNSLQKTGSIKHENVCKGMTMERKQASFIYRGRIKNDRKEWGQGRTGKKSRQYKEWEQRRRACVFSVGRRNGRYGRNGKR